MIETSLQEFLCGFHVAMRRDRRHGRDFILAPAHGRGRANVGLVHVDTSAARWWYTYPFEKYEFVSWDYDIPNIWKVIKFMFQTTNQAGFKLCHLKRTTSWDPVKIGNTKMI